MVGITLFDFPHQAGDVVFHAGPARAAGFRALWIPHLVLNREWRAARVQLGPVKTGNTPANLNERALRRRDVPAMFRVLSGQLSLWAQLLSRGRGGALHQTGVIELAFYLVCRLLLEKKNWTAGRGFITSIADQ